MSDRGEPEPGGSALALKVSGKAVRGGLSLLTQCQNTYVVPAGKLLWVMGRGRPSWL
jgi:hypothetical protein